MPGIVIVTPWDTNNNRNEMLAASAYPAEWTEKNGQAGEHISLGSDRCLAFGKVSADQLTAIAADNRFAVLWSGEADDMPDLSVEAVADAEAVRAAIANAYHDDVARLAVADADTLADVVAVVHGANLYPVWQPDIDVTAGEVYYYDGNLYEVVQSHATQADWTPAIAVALWTRHYEIGGEPEPWRQPLGAHDAYRVGVRVTHNGFTWENTSPANVFEPGVFGWTNLTPPPATPEWQPGVAYALNDEVTYQGSTYRCRQSHTSQVGWHPPAVPALWLLV